MSVATNNEKARIYNKDATYANLYTLTLFNKCDVVLFN